MYCVQQGNPRPRLWKGKINHLIYIFSCDTKHNHLISEALVNSEETKQSLAELVSKDPAAEAIKTVNIEIVEFLYFHIFFSF